MIPNRLTAVVMVFMLLATSFLPVAANNTSKNAKRTKAQQLVAMLPASDGVITMDIQRFFGEAIPAVLSSNKGLRDELFNKVGELREKTGIDLEGFDFVAVGLKTEQIGEKKYNVLPVIIARGSSQSSAAIAAAKSAADNKYKEESVNGKTMFVFSKKEVMAQAKPDNSAEKEEKKEAVIDTILSGISDEVAITAIDVNTVAFGDSGRVRTLLEGKSKIGSDVVRLLNRKEFGVINFAAKLPAGLKDYLPKDNDELGASVDALEYVFGNMNVGSGAGTMSITGKTAKIQQAAQLLDTLDVLQTLGGSLLGGSKREDQQLYARLIAAAKFSRKDAEISMDLIIPQKDIDMLVAILAK
ncbi:MAG: hypothetical protein KF685_05810 [Acidobacteria bacterium]|nr:hypothetical protein [Acidobacteriota bacterium]